MRSSFFPIVLLLLLGCVPSRAAEEPLLRPNDVIALVGGQDMVEADESGLFEFLLQRLYPHFHLKVRCLAWEGDTVFEQPRMLNYPTLEQQLDEIGATVVLMQFGKMESLEGAEKLPAFTEAYSKLIQRLAAADKRRIAIFVPDLSAKLLHLIACFQQLAPDQKAESTRAEYTKAMKRLPPRVIDLNLIYPLQDERRKAVEAELMAFSFRYEVKTSSDSLINLIYAKNRLWNNYRRPQNWAFLAGDRTNQPSSRDHLDNSKRWFPEEMKQWLPLIDSKEQEIWKLATELDAK